MSTDDTLPRRSQGLRPAQPLTVDQIVTVATRIIDEQGAAALTMRALAAELHVTKNAIAWHVGNRGRLLGLVGATWVATVSPSTEGADPTRWLHQLANCYRAAAHRNPNLARLVADGMSTRPEHLPLVEELVAGLEATSVPAAELAFAYKAVLSATIGFVELELAHRSADHVAAGPLEHLDASEHPTSPPHDDTLRYRSFGFGLAAADPAHLDESFSYLIDVLTAGLNRRRQESR